MFTTLNDLVEIIQAKDSVQNEDILTLRQAVFGDANISVSEAKAVFDLNDNVSDKDTAWNEFYTDAMTDFIVRQSEPYGYIDASNAEWLIDRISQDGIVETITELRTLVTIVKTAKSCPDTLIAFTLSQVRNAILHGQGVIGRGRRLSPGIVGRAEVELMRDILYACGSESKIGISRVEAEFLLDINDRCQTNNNDPAWRELFVKAIANHVISVTTYDVPDAKEALRRENWLLSDNHILSSFGQLKFKDLTREVSSFFKSDDSSDAYPDNAITERIDAEEAAWLVSNIGKNGSFDTNEQALMLYLEAECPNLHISLQALIADARLAA